MHLVLGSLTLKCYVSIADIEDEVLLGADVLQQEGNTADILLSRGVMWCHVTARHRNTTETSVSSFWCEESQRSG